MVAAVGCKADMAQAGAQDLNDNADDLQYIQDVIVLCKYMFLLVFKYMRVL